MLSFNGNLMAIDSCRDHRKCVEERQKDDSKRRGLGYIYASDICREAVLIFFILRSMMARYAMNLWNSYIESHKWDFQLHWREKSS